VLKLNRMTDYAIVLLAHMPRGEAPVATARDLAERARLPWPTVVKLLKLLTAEGILRSVQGRHGGYKLARHADEVSLNDVIEAVEGRVGLTECTRQGGQCGIKDSCAVRRHWPAINGAVRNSLDAITLETLAVGADFLEAGARGVQRQRIPRDRPLGGGS